MSNQWIIGRTLFCFKDLGDGPLEQAGENVDQATGNQQNQDGADALSDLYDTHTAYSRTLDSHRFSYKRYLP